MMERPTPDSAAQAIGLEGPRGDDSAAGPWTGLRARACTALALACLPVAVAVTRRDLQILSGGIADAPGVALVAAGAFLALRSHLVCAKWAYRAGTTAGPGPSHLAIQGPYGRLRNPFDLGVGVLLLGELCLMPSAALAMYLAACALAVHLIVTRREEPALARRFGRAYVAYAGVVPRWIPRLTQPS
jgi:protein-S-isoprenylcysteine O-methyltransferase Ste14